MKSHIVDIQIKIVNNVLAWDAPGYITLNNFKHKMYEMKQVITFISSPAASVALSRTSLSSSFLTLVLLWQ